MLRHVGVLVQNPTDYFDLERKMREFVSLIRSEAETRNIKVPRRIRFGGCAEPDAFVCYNSNNMRDLIIELAEQSTVVKRGGHYAKTGV